MDSRWIDGQYYLTILVPSAQADYLSAPDVLGYRVPVSAMYGMCDGMMFHYAPLYT
jgi:hypothetical protein